MEMPSRRKQVTDEEIRSLRNESINNGANQVEYFGKEVLDLNNPTALFFGYNKQEYRKKVIRETFVELITQIQDFDILYLSRIDIWMERIKMKFILDKVKYLFGDSFDLKEFKSKILSGEVTDDWLEDRIRMHEEQVIQGKQRLEIISQRTKESVKKRIYEMVEDGTLPESAKNNLGRLDDLDVEYFDRLLDVKMSKVGDNRNGGGVRIFSELLEPENESELVHVLTHEFAHEISGFAVEIYGDSETRYKLGLQVNEEGRWLNEAATELLTQMLVGKDANRFIAYIAEVELLGNLLELGLDKNILWNAYFENFQKDTSGQKLNPAKSNFRVLVDAINLLQIGSTEVSNWIFLSKRFRKGGTGL